MSADLIESELAGYSLESLTFGGAPAADVLTTRARAAFPTVTLFVFIFVLKRERCFNFLSAIDLKAMG